MNVSYASAANDDRRQCPIGRIRAASGWRGGHSAVTENDCLAAVRALILEAEGVDADAIVEVRFEIDSLLSADIDAANLTRVAATGLAVRYGRAA